MIATKSQSYIIRPVNLDRYSLTTCFMNLFWVLTVTIVTVEIATTNIFQRNFNLNYLKFVIAQFWNTRYEPGMVLGVNPNPNLEN